jgi:acetyl-CoA carboxylase biotin carboxyl carrier protein
MSDQEPTKPPPSSNDERQPKTNQQANQTQQPERGERRNERDRGGRRRHSQNQPQQQQQQQQRRAAEPSLNVDELRELVELIAQHGFTDFELEREGIRVRLRREVAQPAAAAPTVAPAAQAQPPAPVASAAPGTHSAPPAATTTKTEAPPKAAAPEEDLHVITSPIVGTFYRSPSPDSDPFVRIGSHVSQDTVVCIIEAMKLMNDIQAETSGEVVKIYVENGQPVEYGQPLFGIKK